jgi:hypothetical protein
MRQMRSLAIMATLALVGCQTTNEASTQATDRKTAESKSDADPHFITSECGKVAPGAIGLIGAPLGLGGWFVATGVAHLADQHACSEDKGKRPWTDPDKAKPG